MEDNKHLTWYEKYHTWMMLLLAIVFLIAFVTFVKVFFKTEPQNQAGQILIDNQGNEVQVIETSRYESDGRELVVSTREDGSVYGTYTVNGLVGNFEGRYSENGDMLYTTMEYSKDGKMVSEEMIFKIGQGSVGVGIGQKYLGKNGIDIYEDLESTDFISVVLKKTQ